MTQTTDARIDFRLLVQNEITNSPTGRIEDIAFKKPIILGGCGSSGTTLLKTILDSHKNIACGREISFFDRPRLFKTTKTDLHRMFLEQNFQELDSDQLFPLMTQFGTYFGLFLPNSGKHYHSFAATNRIFDKASDLKHFFDLYFSNFAAGRGKKRWAEKTPNNVFCIEQILEFFPDGKFVHVIRDGRDVVLSLTGSRSFNLHAAIIRWLLAVGAGIRHRGHPRYYEIKYEDIVLNTEPTLRGLMEFLDEEYDPAMLDFQRAGQDNPLGYGSTPIFTDSIGKWKKADLDPGVKETMHLTLTPLLEKCRYN